MEVVMKISLDEIAVLARALIDASGKVEEAENFLKTAKERERLLKEETIPSAMREIGLEKIKLETGETITIKEDVYASIPKNNKKEALEWLDSNGLGGVIKRDISVLFGRDCDEARIKVLIDFLIENGYEFSQEESVHAQTLKALIREQLAKGSAIPLDLFGAMPVTVAKIS